MVTKFAFVFPGQGSQKIGMLAAMAEQFPIVIETFQEASDYLGFNLWKLVQEDPEGLLNQTEYTQPALFTAEVALWRIWQAHNGPIPTLMAGHSLGEYAALHCAKVFDFDVAVKLVSKRGKIMQEAVPPESGAMGVIIGLDNQAITDLCQQSVNGVVMPANYNSMNQTVVSGDHQAVIQLIERAKKLDAKIAKLLPVSVPSHCALMKPAADKLSTYISTLNFQPPTIPVLHNVDVLSYNEPHDIHIALIKQLYYPVQWLKTIQTFTQHGITSVIECGPGKVLTNLNKRINKQLTTIAINTPERLNLALGEIKRCH